MCSLLGSVALIEERRMLNLASGIFTGLSVIFAAATSVYYGRGKLHMDT